MENIWTSSKLKSSPLLSAQSLEVLRRGFSTEDFLRAGPGTEGSGDAIRISGVFRLGDKVGDDAACGDDAAPEEEARGDEKAPEVGARGDVAASVRAGREDEVVAMKKEAASWLRG